MTVDEALELADAWYDKIDPHDVNENSGGWRIVAKVLADEVRKLRKGTKGPRRAGNAATNSNGDPRPMSTGASDK